MLVVLRVTAGSAWINLKNKSSYIECAVITISDGFGGDEAEVSIRGFGIG